jgi:hypothetical protein
MHSLRARTLSGELLLPEDQMVSCFLLRSSPESSESVSAVAPLSVPMELRRGMSVLLVVGMVIGSLPCTSSATAGPPVTAPSSSMIASRQQPTSVSDEGSVNPVKAPAVVSNGRFFAIEGRLDRLEVGLGQLTVELGQLKVGLGAGLLLAAAAYVDTKKTMEAMRREMKADKAEMKKEMAELRREMQEERKQDKGDTDLKFVVTLFAGIAITWYQANK